MRLADIPADSEQWARRRVEPLPPRWGRRLLNERRATEALKGEREANLAFVDLMERLTAWRLPLAATDGEICDAAERAARECWELFRNDRDAAARYCARMGVEPPGPGVDDGPALARMRCPLWWRRKLRNAHAQTVEGCAIRLGYVSKRADRYVSRESLRRRLQQIKRNAATLENTIAENELCQRFTLAELASRSVANKEIRRGELITRLKGFESIALDLGHAAEFITITCPSRMHPTSKGERNARYDGTTPREAQQYLCRQWAKMRAAAHRAKLPVYGFRITEPHADGCPHWHLILFAQPEHLHKLREIVRRYALQIDGDEPGAAEHRAKFEAIDASKGSAVGYVIKYIAKNIDGFKVGDWKIDGDLLGDATLNLSPRIEAWASTWRVRQFQQIGGPPVGLWREMRRVKREELANAPDTARDCWLAAQRIEEHRKEMAEPLVLQRADFGAFTVAAGGPLMARKDRPLQLHREATGQQTRYGEERPPQPRGLIAEGRAWYVRQMGLVQAWCGESLRALVQSVRLAWRIVSKGVQAARRAAPWTRVNNCTAINKDLPSERGCRMPVGGGERDPARGKSPPCDAEEFRSWAY